VQLPPDDQFLAAYINQSIHLVNISDYLMNNKAKTLKKNYGLNKYYYGEMNNGVPTGDGIIYEPNKILMNGYF
jgi:hypothetical protein